MSKPLATPEYLKIYMLLKRSNGGLFFYPSGAAAPLGTGFYLTKEDAEKARTLEFLSNNNEDKFYIFELEVPNPAYIKNNVV